MNRFTLNAALLVMCAVHAARADVHPNIASEFSLQVGTFFSEGDLSGSVDGNVMGENPEYDFDTQFGIAKDDNLVAAEFGWRFTPKWSAHLQYFSPDRSGTAVLEEDIEFGDVIFEQGSSVSASTGLEVLRLYFGREFSKREDMSYGIGVGLHRLEIDLSLTGNLISNGQPVINGTRSASLSAPLPNIGAWYAWSPSAKWELSARADWLSASIDEYDGSLWNGAIGANYQVFKHVGIGAKYQAFRLDLEVDKSAWNGNVELSYEGFFVYLSANWN